MDADLADIYDELRRTARSLLRRERVDHTMESCDLVHVAWGRLLVGDLSETARQDPRQVLAAAVLHMRRALVDHARRRRAARRPEGRRRVDLLDAPGLFDEDPQVLVDVDRLLDRLAAGDPADRVRHGDRRANVARYALYAGLTEAEIGELLDLPKSTVGNDLRFARAWLAAHLHEVKP